MPHLPCRYPSRSKAAHGELERGHTAQNYDKACKGHVVHKAATEPSCGASNYNAWVALHPVECILYRMLEKQVTPYFDLQVLNSTLQSGPAGPELSKLRLVTG